MLDDKYRIERLLAVGGMGAVYVGTHVKLRKRVAIKILNPQLSSPLMIERFHREAITASQIGHEGIAQVTDIGTSSQGEPFLVMEYLEGESLASRLRTSGAMQIEVACELGCAILSPLGAAHAAGIVHRDLKPDNVFLVRQSRGEMVKLLDFGISRTTGLDTEFRLTTTGLILGTPYYMSPEQARGDSEVGPATDLYAFGVILYEMLIGHVPIQAENYNQLMYRVMTGDFVRPIEKRPNLPPALDELILRTMSRAPADRPASAAELEQALTAFCGPTFRDHALDGERISTPRLPHKTTPTPFTSPAPKQVTGTDRTLLATPNDLRATPTLITGPSPTVGGKRSKMPLVVGLVALLGIGVGAAVMLAGPHGKPTAGSQAAGSASASSAVAKPPAPPVAKPPAPPVAAPITPIDTHPAPPEGSPPATNITFHFAIEPKAATITVDGKPVTGGELVVPKDDATHELRIAAPGYLTHAEQIRFDESQRLVVPLKRQTLPTKRPHKITNRIEDESPYK
ncbi:MAG: Protein kinase [Myxococcales bacterium]|nr:Protein kinase [Myxococcales bacterium]